MMKDGDILLSEQSVLSPDVGQVSLCGAGCQLRETQVSLTVTNVFMRVYLKDPLLKSKSFYMVSIFGSYDCPHSILCHFITVPD